LQEKGIYMLRHKEKAYKFSRWLSLEKTRQCLKKRTWQR
jgi:hypothetical protein